MIVWLSCLRMHLSVDRDWHTHTHTHTQSSIFDEKGADEQRSLLTGVEKCASGVDSEAAARMGNGASRWFAARPPLVCPRRNVCKALIGQVLFWVRGLSTECEKKWPKLQKLGCNKWDLSLSSFLFLSTGPLKAVLNHVQRDASVQHQASLSSGEGALGGPHAREAQSLELWRLTQSPHPESAGCLWTVGLFWKRVSTPQLLNSSRRGVLLGRGTGL